MNRRFGFILVSLAVSFPLGAGDFENLSRRCATKDHDEAERERVSQENSRFQKARADAGQELALWPALGHVAPAATRNGLPLVSSVSSEKRTAQMPGLVVSREKSR